MSKEAGEKAANMDKGKLTVVGTPIGNLGDISPRALEALGDCDCVLAEDTRVTGKLLAHFGIKARMERCDENVIAIRAPKIVSRIEAGERICLCSDAGMPCISDPGAALVDTALDSGVQVDVVPGPSAVVTALAASGFSNSSFYFGGFLPRKKGEREKALRGLSALNATLVFYESPHRVLASLESVAGVFGKSRVCVCRELTKLHEEVLRGTAEEIAGELKRRGQVKGEIVLLVEGDGSGAGNPADLERAVANAEELVAQGATKSEAARASAASCGLSRREIYEALRK